MKFPIQIETDNESKEAQESYRSATLGGTMDIEKEKCQVCGGQAKQFVFATFVCNNEECVDKARLERGGPGGHMKNKHTPPFTKIEDEKK
jgi:hypothetical protein